MGYLDADWVDDLIRFSGAAVNWRSKKQVCFALSTAETEYMALISSAQLAASSMSP